MPFVKVRIDINPRSSGFGVGEFKRDFLVGDATKRLVDKDLGRQLVKTLGKKLVEYNIERKAKDEAKDNVPT